MTSAMKPYAEMDQRLVVPTNEQFASFLTSADADQAAAGQMPEVERKFSVQTTKALIGQFVSTQDFGELKRIVKAENEEVLKKAEAQIPGLLQKLNTSISNDYDVDLELAMAQMLPLPPHHETERGLAYSMILKYTANDERGTPHVFEGVATVTFVHLQGKILFLYSNAEKSGLEWSREESKKWADRIIAANPSTGAVAIRETSQRRSGFDSSRLLKNVIIGAVIGGLIGLVRYGVRKKKGERSN